LLAVYGAATVVCFSRGNFGAASAIAQYLGMPRETVRRHLCQLVELGLLQRAGHKFALTAATQAMPRNVIEILSDQTLGAATIAKTGHHQLRQEVMTSLGVDMDSPALLWACKPDGTGMMLGLRLRTERGGPFTQREDSSTARLGKCAFWRIRKASRRCSSQKPGFRRNISAAPSASANWDMALPRMNRGGEHSRSLSYVGSRQRYS